MTKRKKLYASLTREIQGRKEKIVEIFLVLRFGIAKHREQIEGLRVTRKKVLAKNKPPKKGGRRGKEKSRRGSSNAKVWMIR